MKTKEKKSALERSIISRERGIKQMRDDQKRRRTVCEEECAAIDRRIAEKLILLNALKRGAISA